MAATATSASFAAFSATFFARELAVIVGVEPRECRVTAGIELLPRQHAIAVRVGLEHAVLAFWPALVLGQGDAGHPGERCEASGGEQYLSHLKRLLPADPLASAMVPDYLHRFSRVGRGAPKFVWRAKKAAGAREMRQPLVFSPTLGRETVAPALKSGLLGRD
jgi:hypothetical protein